MVTSTVVMLLLPTSVHNLNMIDGRSERCDGKSGISIALALPLSTPFLISCRSPICKCFLIKNVTIAYYNAKINALQYTHTHTHTHTHRGATHIHTHTYTQHTCTYTVKVINQTHIASNRMISDLFGW